VPLASAPRLGARKDYEQGHPGASGVGLVGEVVNGFLNRPALTSDGEDCLDVLGS
jgi:hypothetical protein